MKIFVLYSFIGAFQGIITFILFFQMDIKWKRNVSLLGGTTGIAAVYSYLNNLLGTLSSIELFMSISIAFIASVILSFIGMCFALSCQKEKVKIRPLDIIIAHKSFFEDYYKNRQKEIDEYLNYDKLQAKDELLKVKESEITHASEFLEEKKDQLDKAMKDIPYLKLPLKNKIPIDNGYIKLLPFYTHSFSGFITNLDKLTTDFNIKYIQYADDSYTYLIGYFIAICTYISEYLFETNANSVRVHFRILVNNNYEKLVGAIGGNRLTDSLTKIPIGHETKSMISVSSDNNCSLIRSLNDDFHFPGDNDAIWEDYISFALNDFKLNGTPLLSMGISVNNKELYKNLLYFINHNKIERVIQDYLKIIDKKCNIINILKNYCPILNNEEMVKIDQIQQG